MVSYKLLYYAPGMIKSEELAIGQTRNSGKKIKYEKTKKKK